MIPAALFQYGMIPVTTDFHVSASANAIVLRTLYDASHPTPIAGDTVNLFIDSGVTIGSISASVPSLDTGVWPSGVIVNLTINTNDVVGAGGDGSGPNPGQQGGTALKVRSPINLSMGSGSLKGGGGGGAGTDQWTNGLSHTYRAGGGGGAGIPAGLGYVVTGSFANASGANGTATTGGAGGYFGSDPNQPPQGTYWGGRGGNLGSAGQNGGDTAQVGSEDNVGGAAGYSIDGYSLVTVLVPGTLVGPTNP